MSRVKKEARLSGMLLARKGTAHPAHIDHRLAMQAVESDFASEKQFERPEEFKTVASDQSILVEAVKEINNVTKRQYNNVVNPPEAEKKEKQVEQEKIIAKK